MTDTLLDYDPNDTGDIPRPVGEDRTVIMRVDTGEKTQRIDPRLIHAPSFDAIPRRVYEMDDTVIYMPATIGLAGPQSPPPPLPPPPADETQVHTILDSLDGGHADLDGWLRPDGYVGCHRDPLDRIAVAGQRQWELITDAAKPGGEPRRWRVMVAVGALLAIWSVVTLAVVL